MNATIKSICALLHEDNPNLQISAVRVLGAIPGKESGIVKALCELLLQSEDKELILAILESLRQTPHEQALKHLLKFLERPEAPEEKVLEVIAEIGGKAVPPLRQQFHRAPSPLQRKIVTVLPTLRTPQAHQFLIECYFNPDHEVIRDAVHALRECIGDYKDSEANDLFKKLCLTIKNNDVKQNDTALSAIIISLGILARPSAKAVLLPFISPDHPVQIRRHALMSLARIEYAGDKHHDVFKAVLPILDEDDFDGLVRHAVHLLECIKPARSDTELLRELLAHSRHLGVRIFAVQALSKLDNTGNATSLLELLHSPEIKLREAAAFGLRSMPSAVNVILKHIDEVHDRAEAFEYVRILESHGNRIKPERAKEMIKHMLELYEKGDDHYQLYRMALRHLRGDTLQSELAKRADRLQKKNDFEGVRDTLKLLDHTDLLTPELRYQLAIAKLKTSKKDLARSFRMSDYSLEHIAALLEQDPKGFKKKLLAEKALDENDLLYVGYHFSEHLNEERRFGAELLRHVAKKFGRKKAGATAKKKLKVEGH